MSAVGNWTKYYHMLMRKIHRARTPLLVRTGTCRYVSARQPTPNVGFDGHARRKVGLLRACPTL
jgi:hypothetical protein